MLSDFIATFIGVTRDNLDARLLLTGNFFYRGSLSAPVDDDLMDDRGSTTNTGNSRNSNSRSGTNKRQRLN